VSPVQKQVIKLITNVPHTQMCEFNVAVVTFSMKNVWSL